MGEKHLIETVTHSRQVSAKIKKQSKQVITKQTTKKDGRATFCWLYHAKLTLVYLHSLYASVFQKLQMFRYKSDAMKNELNRFPSCFAVRNL